jgi:hypothetical protein
MFGQLELLTLAVGGPKRKTKTQEEIFKDKLNRLIEVNDRLSEIETCFPNFSEIQHLQSIAHRQGDK